MFDVIIKLLFVLFAVFGIVEISRLFLFWLLKTEHPGKLFLAVSLCGHNDDVEVVLRSACERAKWMIGGEAAVLVVDCGMDEETRRICEIACRDMPELRLCRPEDLAQTICG